VGIGLEEDRTDTSFTSVSSGDRSFSSSSSSAKMKIQALLLNRMKVIQYHAQKMNVVNGR
jgi:hypothetical protein